MPGTPEIDPFIATEVETAVDQALAYQAAALHTIGEFGDTYVAEALIEAAGEQLALAEALMEVAVEGEQK
jgi:hypothetical protein